MSVGRGLRTVRCALFALVCVLLAALAHVMMSGSAVPWWALGTGATAGAAIAWCLAGRERGLLLVSSVVAATQLALHEWFTYAQRLLPPAATAKGHSVHAEGVAAAHEHLHHLGHPGLDVPATGAGPVPEGFSSAGMMTAHILAALLSGLWLAHGERAVFRILRALASRLTVPARLLHDRPETPVRARVPACRHRVPHGPRLRLLTHAITSRGPPGTAAVL
ncbi:hypothetical protein G6W47_03675 [Streptomyces sp. CAI-21]|uniref:Integral membrane protein n=1 Tax=Streptomyces albidoflavus TaxID=1886 RepID=A0ABY3GRE0_9ACTN|nr:MULTISPECIES: hypothetical protein [Streptomyces]MBO1283704.1 hypothetical protein [Streptomyces sampsonii]NUW06029.1 hypothetical protein [Streptomyces sp. CAI-21]RZE84380.1 hypothetical protein C0Q99_00945 [Streptomyces albidoflavus]TWV18093.1 hypothetical protein FRZ02_30605 [Streptomyces albidoflavus]